MTQLSLFDALRPSPIILPIDPHGHVLQGEAHYTFALPHPRLAGNCCRIELHPASDSLWMWSVSFQTDAGYGRGYKVGGKWGLFVPSAEDALWCAINELTEWLAEIPGHDRSAVKILTWANSLTLQVLHA